MFDAPHSKGWAWPCKDRRSKGEVPLRFAKQGKAKARLSSAARSSAKHSKGYAVPDAAMPGVAKQRLGRAGRFTAPHGNAKAEQSYAWPSKAKAWRPVVFGPAGMSLYIAK